MTEKLIEEVYESWGNSWGFPSESMKEKIIAFAKMLLQRVKEPIVEVIEVDNTTTTKIPEEKLIDLVEIEEPEAIEIEKEVLVDINEDVEDPIVDEEE